MTREFADELVFLFNKCLTMTPPQPSETPWSFPQTLPLRHSRRPLAGIHVDLGFRAAAGQGQGRFPITPLGNDGAMTRE